MKSLVFCGIIEWPWEEDSRYLGLLYKSNDFEGKVILSDEGKVYWMKKSELFTHQTSEDLDKMFEIIESRNYPEEK